MKICAIIAEFNPFHSGHKYLFETAKQVGFTHIVVIMSGNFVQRGEPAVYSKRVRAQVAIKNGADLVIEMPCVWAVSRAERYADAGVFLADALGCVDSLIFGSECGDLQALFEVKNSFETSEFQDDLHKYLGQGITFAKARELAIKETISCGNFLEILNKPNNILGIEYLKAIEKHSSKIIPVTVKREEKFICASKIREMIKSEIKDFSQDFSFEIKIEEPPKDLFFGEKAVVSRLKIIPKNAMRLLPDISEGLENRIFNSLNCAENLDKLLETAKSKRYTMARIKRIILCACLGITEEIQSKSPPYLRILGATKKGLEVLNRAKLTASLPVISRSSDFNGLDKFAERIFELECNSTDFYGNFSKELKMLPSEKLFKFIRQ